MREMFADAEKKQLLVVLTTIVDLSDVMMILYYFIFTLSSEYFTEASINI